MRLALYIIILLTLSKTQSQTYFKVALNDANPVSAILKKTTPQKIKIHTLFLQKAIQQQNKTHELYGYIYLFNDYYNSSNYVMTSYYFLKAENLVSKHQNPSWEAALHFKKALILEIKNDQNGKLEQFQKAYEKSKIAKDSLYMAEGLEQISATYGEMDEYQKAESYFQLALPLIKKFESKQYIALTYNNYSNLKSFQNQKAAALKNINIAIKIIKETNDTYTEMMYQVNKAAVLTEMKQFEKSELLLKTCEKINLKNNWKDRLTHNYIGFADLYEHWGKYQLSLKYYIKHYEEKESLGGKEIRVKIADLENENSKNRIKIELKDNQIKIIKYKRKIDQLILVTLIILILLFSTFYFWKRQKTKSKAEFEEKLNDLKKLTNLLISKNNTLLNQKNTNQEIRDNEFNNLFIKKILTDSDWLTFKACFEKAYPNYINRVRTAYPKLTAAEERLFLCLKLNLNNKEVASILGISNDGVKKCRNRLRKRIDLNIMIKLNDYIRDF